MGGWLCDVEVPRTPAISLVPNESARSITALPEVRPAYVTSRPANVQRSAIGQIPRPYLAVLLHTFCLSHFTILPV